MAWVPRGQGSVPDVRMGQKIDRAFILSELLLSLNTKAVEGSHSFILAVDALEDNLAPYDEEYLRAAKDMNTAIDGQIAAAQKRMADAEGEPGDVQREKNAVADLEWRRARAKLRLLNSLLKRTGLEKELRITLKEGLEDDENESQGGVPETAG